MCYPIRCSLTILPHRLLKLSQLDCTVHYNLEVAFNGEGKFIRIDPFNESLPEILYRLSYYQEVAYRQMDSVGGGVGMSLHLLQSVLVTVEVVEPWLISAHTSPKRSPLYSIQHGEDGGHEHIPIR